MNQPIDYLYNRITLDDIPFTERGSRIMVLRRERSLLVQLAESATAEHPITYVTIELLNADGSPLDFNIATMPHRVDITTRHGDFALGFADAETLIIRLPAGRCGIRLRTPLPLPQPDRRGGIFRAPGNQPLTIAYTTNARIGEHRSESAEGTSEVVLMVDSAQSTNCFALNLTRTLPINRHIPDFDAVTEAARSRWQTWFDSAPTVPEAYRAQYYFAWWVLGINLIRLYAHPQHEGLIPSKRGYVGVWNWDAYFHAIALRHVDAGLAQDQFRILLAHQLASGMIPDVIQDYGAITHTTAYGIDADITKPPLTAWAVWKVYEVDGDKAFLDEVYDALVRAHRWWFVEQDTDHDGFCEYAHPYSSGLDNSPLFDRGAPLESPDLNAYLILQADHLAEIAWVLGRDDEAQEWTRAAEALAQRLVDLRWDKAAGYFWARCRGEIVPVRTPMNLFPLITGRMPSAVAQRLVEHLTDPEQFWAHFPVTTVAQDDPTFDPNTMWRGPVWININYLLIDGLRRAGFAAQAQALRSKTLELMLRQPDIYEYYNPHTGEKPPRAVSSFGWSAALFIDLVLSEIAPPGTP
jgi:glycogen debranching enzyme